MFDLGFSELIVVFVIALVVLGPTRLPQLAAKVGRWIGKARSMARQFREQLESEVQLEELNRMTEERTREAKASTPPPPPGMNGEPVPPAPGTDSAVAQSGYPYAAPEPAASAPWPADPSDPGAPRPGDDEYSHAHAAGGAPMPYHPEADVYAPAAPEVVQSVAQAPSAAEAAPASPAPAHAAPEGAPGATPPGTGTQQA